MSEITTRTIKITPVYAQELLNNSNFKNRTINNQRLENYAKDMKDNNWLVNGASIVLDEENNVIDGQHRLRACVLSGCDFETIIVHNAKNEAFKTIDKGRSRTFSDTLHTLGYINRVELSALLHRVHMYEKYKKITSRNKIHKEDVLMETLAEDEEFLMRVCSISIGKYRSLSKIFKKSSLTFCLYLFMKINEKDAFYFFDTIRSGLFSSEKCPMKQLKDKMVNARMKTLTESIPQNLEIAYIIKSWNLFRSNNQIKKLYIDVRSENYETIKPI